MWPKMKDDYGNGVHKDRALRRRLPVGCHLYIVDPQIRFAADYTPTLVVYAKFFVEPKND